MTLPSLGADPLTDLGLDGSSGDDWSPDNWLVDQVQQLATPAVPAEGPRVRNEPNTVPAPMGAGASGGGLATAIDAAMSKLDTMYDWGGTGTGGRGVDCSGLIYFAYRAAGFNLERYRAVDYGRMGREVAADEARAGDIVYHDNPNSDTDHVGIYLGNGQFIESPQPGSKVQISPMQGRGMTIRRIVPDSAYRGLPRTDTGNLVYSHDNTDYVSAKAPGPQRDPLEMVDAIEAGDPLDAMLGLHPDIQMAIAGQTQLDPGSQEAAAGTPGQPRGHGGDAFGQFLGAVSGQESGGDYSVQNSIGAIGKYQVMYYNVGPWTLGALGRTMSPQEFRHSPAAQEAVARWRLGSLVAEHGYRGAAAAWYSGNPSRHNDYKPLRNGSGPSVGDYVDQVLARMG